MGSSSRKRKGPSPLAVENKAASSLLCFPSWGILTEGRIRWWLRERRAEKPNWWDQMKADYLLTVFLSATALWKFCKRRELCWSPWLLESYHQYPPFEEWSSEFPRGQTEEKLQEPEGTYVNSHFVPEAVSHILLTLSYASKGLSQEWWWTLGKITWKPYQGKLHPLPTPLPILHTSSSFVIFSADISTTDAC